jgi:hypothetical protein
MPKAACSDEEFVELFTTLGGGETARVLKITERNVYKRRRSLERRLATRIYPPTFTSRFNHSTHNPSRLQFDISDGQVLVGSDAHVWPNDRTTGQTAFAQFAKTIQPDIIILNGDVLDGATISRHASIGWEGKPSLASELEAVTEYLAEIEKAAPNAKRVWTLGNHDARFETRLANEVPEYAGIQGVHLKDHFPRWHPCWSAWINDDVVIKHRFKGGIHAAHNNTLWSGKSILTGHLHSLKVTPFTDYNGTRYGVDTGTLARPEGNQFLDYTEDNPKNWRSGFVILTFRDSALLWPEIVHVIAEGEVEFRGEIISC